MGNNETKDVVNTDPVQEGTLPFKPRLKRLARRTVRDWTERSVGTYASSIAFFFSISLIPMIIILLQLLPYAGLSQTELLSFIEQLIPESVYWLAVMVIREAYSRSVTVLSASAIVLIWSASRGTMALRWGLNRVYGVKERRRYPILCLIAIGYTAALLIIFSIILFLVFAGPVSRFLAENIPEIFADPVTVRLRQKVLLYLLMVVLFTLVYTFIPAGSRKFHRQIPGAVFVTFLWEIFSSVFSIYIRGYNAYTMFYGSLGAVAIILFWLYCCFYILLIGAYVNRFFGIRWERLKTMIVERRPYE